MLHEIYTYFALYCLFPDVLSSKPQANADGDQNLVDLVHDAVGGAHVGGDHVAVVHLHVAGVDLDPEAVLVRVGGLLKLAVVQAGGVQGLWHHVVLQGLLEPGLVSQQVVEVPGVHLGEGGVGGGEQRLRVGEELVGDAGGHHGGQQRGQLGVAGHHLLDGLGGRHDDAVDEMDHAVAHHDVRLRDLLAVHGGHVVVRVGVEADLLPRERGEHLLV